MRSASSFEDSQALPKYDDLDDVSSQLGTLFKRLVGSQRKLQQHTVAQATEIRQLKHSNSTLKKTVADLEQTTLAQATEIRQLKHSNSTLKKTVADLEQKFAELSNAVTAVKLDLITTKQHVGIVHDARGESEPQPMLRQESKDAANMRDESPPKHRHNSHRDRDRRRSQREQSPQRDHSHRAVGGGRKTEAAGADREDDDGDSKLFADLQDEDDDRRGGGGSGTSGRSSKYQKKHDGDVASQRSADGGSRSNGHGSTRNGRRRSPSPKPLSSSSAHHRRSSRDRRHGSGSRSRSADNRHSPSAAEALIDQLEGPPSVRKGLNSRRSPRKRTHEEAGLGTSGAGGQMSTGSGIDRGVGRLPRADPRDTERDREHDRDRERRPERDHTRRDRDHGDSTSNAAAASSSSSSHKQPPQDQKPPPSAGGGEQKPPTLKRVSSDDILLADKRRAAAEAATTGGDHKKSIELATEAVRLYGAGAVLDPDWDGTIPAEKASQILSSLLTIATCHARLQNYAGAHSTVDIAIRVNPNHHKNYSLKATLLSKQKRFSKSIELFRKAEQVSTTEQDKQKYLQKLIYVQKKWDQERKKSLASPSRRRERR